MGFGVSQQFPILFRVASESFRPARCSEVLVNVGQISRIYFPKELGDWPQNIVSESHARTRVPD